MKQILAAMDAGRRMREILPSYLEARIDIVRARYAPGRRTVEERYWIRRALRVLRETEGHENPH